MRHVMSAIACTVALSTGAGENADTWQVLGMGGGGCFLGPAASPHDPNLIFTSSDMGGVYRSEDGAKSWRMLDWRQIQTVRAPVFHPTDPNVIYACANDGRALRVSRDRGKNWSVVEGSWKGVRTLAIDRGNPNLLLLSCEKELYRSEDGAKTWAAVPNAPGRLIGIHFDQTTPADKRVCLAGNKDDVFRSSDGGLTWAPASKGLPWREIRAFCGGSDPKSGRAVVYCAIPSKKVDDKFAGGVFRSTDRGETWEPAMGAGINTALGKQDEYAAEDIDQYHFLAQAETVPDTIYVTNRSTGYYPPHAWTVYRSDDAGKNWRACFFNDHRFKEFNTELSWLYYDHSRGFGDQAWGFNVNAANPEQVFYTNFAEIFMTTDGGKKWAQIQSRREDGQGPPAKGQRWASIGIEDTSCWRYVFDPHEKNRTYICYTDIGFMRSEDRGKSWCDATAGIPWRNTIYDLACDPEVPGLLFAACANQHDIPGWQYIQGATAPGGVCKSADFGKTWKPCDGLPKAPATALLLDPTSPKDKRVLYAAIYAHGIFKSVDGGATWTNKSAGIEPEKNRQVYCLQRWKDGTLFCSVAGRRKGKGVDTNLPGGVYVSADKAETWKRITTDDIFRPVDFAVHPEDKNTIYVAVMDGLSHTGGVYKTTDGGAKWENLNVQYDKTHCSYIEGYNVTLNPKDPNIVYFFAHTHGMFLSRDAGKTWEPLKAPKAPPFMVCSRIYWDPEDPKTVYIVTFGGSVWKGPDPAF